MAILFRLLSVIALIAALLAGTVDAIRSVSESAVVLTPLGGAVASISTSGLELIEALERPDGSMGLVEPVVRWVLRQPAFAILLIVSLVFWMAGYRPERRRRLA